MKATISNLQGPRAAVSAKIANDEKIPLELRALINSLIAALPAEFTGARVDFHSQAVNGTVNFSGTVTPLKLAV